MNQPDLLVEIEFTPGVWTDVSADARAVATKRGKQRALDKVNPGTATVILKNDTRVYDPEFTTGPHYGKLLPNKAIRISGVWNAVTYRIFTGSIDSLTQSYDPPRKANTIFRCTDGLANLAAAGLGSPYEVFMARHTPRTWLRMGEQAGPIAFDRSGNWNYGHYFGTPEFGEPNLFFLDDDGSVIFDDVGDFMLLGPNTLPSTLPMTISFAINTSGPIGPAAGHVMWDARYPKGMIISVDYTTGRLAVTYTKENGATWEVSTSIDIRPQFFLITIVLVAGQPAKIYSLGQEVSGATTGVVSLDNIPTYYYMGNFAHGGAHFDFLGIDEFTVFDYALNAADLAELALAATAWNNDNGNARVTRILDAVNWPVAARDITTQFDDTLAATSLKTSALDHLRAIETTIEGRLFIEKDGTLRLLGRNEHISAPYSISSGTFGDAPGELGYTELSDYTLNLELLTNVVRRYNRGTIAGNPQAPQETIIEASNAASIDAYGRRDQNAVADVESLYRNLDDEYGLAQWRLDHYKDPIPYVDGLRLKPYGDPVALWPQALGRELADRITFKRRPQGIGNVIETDTIIEGISHNITPQRWDTTFSIDATGARDYFLFDVTLWDSPDWRFAA